MRRNKTKKTKLVALLLILVLLISVGYAALTTNLQINGNATIKKKSWNVHFTNIVVDTANNVASVDTAPTLSNNDTTVTWGVSMNTPGQVYKFNVDVINEGTIDAMVNTATNSIVTSALTTEQQEYLDYTITYVNGAAIEQYDKLAAGETKTITVKLLFKQDINPEDLPATAQNGISLSYETNYVQADGNARTKVTALPEPLEIGDTVNYSTTLNGQTLNNWKVFYVDGDYTYIILDDYLPNSAVSISGIEKDGTYGVYSNDSREALISAMTTNSNWAGLISNGEINGVALSSDVISDSNVKATGAPTVNLWVNSWNSKYPSDTIYLKEVGAGDIDNNNFYATGYGISDTTPVTSTYVDLSNDTGYGNTLYYPHQEDVSSCYGYWLASPSARYDDTVMNVYCGGYVTNNDYNSSNYAFRPVVCLPSSVVNQ